MTPIQREMLELDARVRALEDVNDWLVRLLRLFHACLREDERLRSVAAAVQLLQEQRMEFAQVGPIPGLDPAKAAVLAARYLRAFDEVATPIEDALQPPPTQEEIQLLGRLQEEESRKQTPPV